MNCLSKTYCGTCRAQIGCSCGDVTHEHRCPNVVIVTTVFPAHPGLIKVDL
jgi:positive regulator of sigma E activity